MMQSDRRWRRRWMLAAAGAPLAWSHHGARAQEQYPSRAIRVVVPFAPGGAADTYARVLGKAASEILGQPLVVENKPGAGTVIGTEAVVRAKPDGYTLLVSSAPLVTNPGLLSKMPYDALKDLAPIVQFSATGFVVSVNERQPYRRFADLVAAARAADIPYASPGSGTLMHLVGQLANSELGTRFIHVPYRGSAPALQDAMSGQIGVIIDPASTSMPGIQQGRLRPLAVTDPKRLPALPDVPTLRELGYPKLEAIAFGGLFAPAGTPAPIVATLNRAFNQAMRLPEVRETFEVKLQTALVGGTPEAFAAFLLDETNRWVPLIRRLGLKAD